MARWYDQRHTGILTNYPTTYESYRVKDFKRTHNERTDTPKNYMLPYYRMRGINRLVMVEKYQMQLQVQ
jgi:hypothetical protein